MNEKEISKTGREHQAAGPGNTETPGYPEYPAGEDIYSRYREEADINPEEISKLKDPIEPAHEGTGNEKDFRNDHSGADLDIPGAELDDALEEVGSEDEENNYYSLGADGNASLDETNHE